MAVRKKIDFTSGSMTKNIITYAVAMVLTVILQNLFGTADMVVVASSWVTQLRLRYLLPVCLGR